MKRRREDIHLMKGRREDINLMKRRREDIILMKRREDINLHAGGPDTETIKTIYFYPEVTVQTSPINHRYIQLIQ